MHDFVQQRVGTTLAGRWTLTRVLGSGGMGAVYAAQSLACAREEVAIKILHPELSRDGHVRERFVREAKVGQHIDHPGVVRVLDQGVDLDGTTFMVMEKLEGESLGELLARGASLSLTALLDLLDDVLDALAVAHDLGVVHRDLKPDNLFLEDSGRVRVLDFGVARMLDDSESGQRTQTGVAIGTLSYMAPEQAMGRRAEIDGRVDLFALGATAFRVLAGRRLHEATSKPALLVAMATKSAPSLGEVAPHLPAPLVTVIDTAVAFSRESRYPDAATMRRDIQALRRGQTPEFASTRFASFDAATLPGRVVVTSTPAVAGNRQQLELGHAPTVAGSPSPAVPTHLGNAATVLAQDAPAAPADIGTGATVLGQDAAPADIGNDATVLAQPTPSPQGPIHPPTPQGPIHRRRHSRSKVVLAAASAVLLAGGFAWTTRGDDDTADAAASETEASPSDATSPANPVSDQQAEEREPDPKSTAAEGDKPEPQQPKARQPDGTAKSQKEKKKPKEALRDAGQDARDAVRGVFGRF